MKERLEEIKTTWSKYHYTRYDLAAKEINWLIGEVEKAWAENERLREKVIQLDDRILHEVIRATGPAFCRPCGQRWQSFVGDLLAIFEEWRGSDA
jgi:hypothetical protein